MKSDVRTHPGVLVAYAQDSLAILEASDPALAKYKCSRREFLQLNLLDLQAAEGRDELRDLLASPQAFICDHGVWRQRDRHGRSFAALLISRDLGKSGRPTRALLVHEVRTEQRALEASLSRGAANICDAALVELKILRRGVRLVDQGLREIYRQTQDLYLHQYASASRSKTSTLTRLVLGVEKATRALDPLNKLAAIPQTGVNRQRLDLSALISSLLTQALQPGQHRKVETKVQPGLMSNADPALMRDALAFLIDSAARSTRSRDVASIQFGCAAHADQTVFYIRDNGVGIDTDHARATGAGQSTMRDLETDEDTGLGLLAVELIFAHHGGRLWIDSVAEMGTTFYFTLPA